MTKQKLVCGVVCQNSSGVRIANIARITKTENFSAVDRGMVCTSLIGSVLMEDGGEKVKVIQSWKRNEPDTISGESITLTTIYSSFDKSEIDDLEQKMPKGIMISETAERRNDDDG